MLLLSAAGRTGVPPPHTPAAQVVPAGPAVAASHEAPSLPVGFEHSPLPGSQVPATWQASSGAHARGEPAAQSPPWQVSFWVQGLPSLQPVPLGWLPQEFGTHAFGSRTLLIARSS